MRSGIFTVLKYLPTNYRLIIYGKIIYSGESLQISGNHMTQVQFMNIAAN